MASPRIGRWLLLAAMLMPISSQALAQSSGVVFSDGFEANCPGPAPGVTVGSGSGLLLRGTVVTPATAFIGELLVVGDTIACAAASCAGQAGAATATIVETNGLIFPGLIDSYNLALFGAFDENDWAPTQLYANHNVWPNDPRYGAMVDAKQYLNGEGAFAVENGCELEKYGELKALLAGTTSIVSGAVPSNLACYGSLARTVDQSRNDLGTDRIQVNTLQPNTATADQVCANFANTSTNAYLVSVAEGVDQAARNEFINLGTVSTVDGCLYAPQTAIIHGTALTDPELTVMAQAGMSLVWTPRSDIALYGATANVPLALSKGINVSLGTTWSITGSHNLLAELRYADQVDNTSWGDILTAQELVQMATTNAAQTLGLEGVLGSISPGKKADLTVVSGSCAAPWAALVAAGPRDIRLVLVGGVALYGDASMQAVAPAAPGCEAMGVCGVAKFTCVAESGTTDKLGQTRAEIVGVLSQGLANYDAFDLSQWNVSPIAPLVDCP